MIDYQKLTRSKITPGFYKTLDQKYHYVDENQAAWRLVEFIPDALSYDIAPSPAVSYQAANAVAKFQLFLNSLDPLCFQDTISNFHNLPARLNAFKAVCDNGDPQLLTKAQNEIKLIREFEFINDESIELVQSLPIRLTHNDTKLNNIIFDGTNWLVIDLDTVMKGFVMWDFGDMIRTFTSPAAEDEKDLDQVLFRLDHFEAIAKAYLGVLQKSLTQPEKESLLGGVYYILYEQSLRFLTDFLQDNKYYKVSYPDHNLVRAKTQLKLLNSTLQKKSALKEMLHRFY